MGFYQNIANTFGRATERLIKQWVKVYLHRATEINRRTFLLKCRRNNIFPRHIMDSTTRITYTARVTDSRDGWQITGFTNRLRHRLINLEIDLVHSSLHKNDKLLIKLDSDIKNIISPHTWNEFKRRMSIKYNRKYSDVKVSNISKFNRLLQQQSVRVNIEDRWLRNLTDITIPQPVKTLLSLGPKFGVPPTVRDISIAHLLSDLEYMSRTIENPNKRDLIRAQTTNIVTNFVHKDPGRHNQFNNMYTECKKFIKEHPDLLISRSDKGNVTVIMYKEHYKRLTQQLLDDNTYYSVIPRNPTSSIQQKSNKIVGDLKRKNYITPEQAKSLTIYNSLAPRFYGLPKVHKQELSLRPIISSIDSPSSKIASLITNILTKSYDSNNDFFVKDSFEFSNLVNDRIIPESHVVVSLDVVSLFTNIPVELAISSVNNKWDTISKNTNIPNDVFLQLIEFVFNSTFFICDGVVYKQIFGTPMGATISPIISQYVMDELLNTCIPKLSYSVPLLKKYVDDIICVIPEGGENEILNVFNSFNPHIQFTIEKETNNSVPFLDTKVIRNNNILLLDWYIKPTSSGRYLNYHSSHSEKMKINLVLGLKNRIYRISHRTLYQKNIKLLYNILIKNSYPPRLLNRLLYNTTADAANNTPQVPHEIERQTNNATPVYAVLPNIEDVTPKLIHTFKGIDIKVAKRNTKTVSNLFTKLKDPIPTWDKSNVVYKIPCADCTQVYIGQTSRNLKSRITSHKSDIRLEKNTCALAEHSITTKHTPNYEEVTTLDCHSSTIKRSFLEMTRIAQEPDCMNKRSDISNLSQIYTYLIEMDKRKLSQTTN